MLDVNEINNMICSGIFGGKGFMSYKCVVRNFKGSKVLRTKRARLSGANQQCFAGGWGSHQWVLAAHKFLLLCVLVKSGSA